MTGPRHAENEARAFLDPQRTAVTVRVDMLDDERSRAEKLIEENGWKRDEGLHIIFSHGLVSLEHEQSGGAEFDGKRLLDMKTPEERERFLLARLSDLESRYSVMKFTSFNALRDNKTLNMNVTGLKTEYIALAEQNKYLRGREDELRSRIAELDRVLADARARENGQRAPTSRWHRIKELARAVLE